jgi:putative hemolysin
VVDVAPQLVLIVVLVAVNAAFAGTEIALLTLRETQLQRLAERSRTGAVLARLARQPNRFLATIQIALTLAGLFASAAAALTLAAPLEARLGVLGRAAAPVAVVIVTLVLAYVTLVFGELAPKRLGMQKAERWALLMARPLDALSRLTRPVVWLLSHSTDVAVRLLGGDPSVHREEVTADELRDMVAVQETFTVEQRQIIDGAFAIAGRTLGEIVVPRGDVFVLDASQPCDDALVALKESGHSRAPVAEDRNLDGALGVVHLRQLIDGGRRPVGEHTSPLPGFPEPARVLTALRELQHQRLQMALVIDEHGGAAGIVTVEDLVEELVGEIYDETDTDLATVHHEAGGVLVVPGRYPVHDLVDLDVDLPPGDYATIAGLVLEELGRFPDAGDHVIVGDWRVEVRSVVRHSITEVAIVPLAPNEPSG